MLSSILAFKKNLSFRFFEFFIEIYFQTSHPLMCISYSPISVSLNSPALNISPIKTFYLLGLSCTYFIFAYLYLMLIF